jgi:hypothetical protein
MKRLMRRRDRTTEGAGQRDATEAYTRRRVQKQRADSRKQNTGHTDGDESDGSVSAHSQHCRSTTNRGQADLRYRQYGKRFCQGLAGRGAREPRTMGEPCGPLGILAACSS